MIKDTWVKWWNDSAKKPYIKSDYNWAINLVGADFQCWVKIIRAHLKSFRSICYNTYVYGSLPICGRCCIIYIIYHDMKNDLMSEWLQRSPSDHETRVNITLCSIRTLIYWCYSSGSSVVILARRYSSSIVVLASIRKSSWLNVRTEIITEARSE